MIVSKDSRTLNTHPAADVALRLDNIEFQSIASHLANRPFMNVDDQKTFGTLILMNSPNYTSGLMEDAYEFTVSYHERVHNF